MKKLLGLFLALLFSAPLFAGTVSDIDKDAWRNHTEEMQSLRRQILSLTTKANRTESEEQALEKLKNVFEAKSADWDKYLERVAAEGKDAPLPELQAPSHKEMNGGIRARMGMHHHKRQHKHKIDHKSACGACCKDVKCSECCKDECKNCCDEKVKKAMKGHKHVCKFCGKKFGKKKAHKMHKHHMYPMMRPCICNMPKGEKPDFCKDGKPMMPPPPFCKDGKAPKFPEFCEECKKANAPEICEKCKGVKMNLCDKCKGVKAPKLCDKCKEAFTRPVPPMPIMPPMKPCFCNMPKFDKPMMAPNCKDGKPMMPPCGRESKKFDCDRPANPASQKFHKTACEACCKVNACSECCKDNCKECCEKKAMEAMSGCDKKVKGCCDKSKKFADPEMASKKGCCDNFKKFSDPNTMAIINSKICFRNMRIIEGGVEMYNMDYDQKMTSLDKENLEKLVEQGYLNYERKCPETGDSYYSNGDLSKDGQISCKIHGSLTK